MVNIYRERTHKLRTVLVAFYQKFKLMPLKRQLPVVGATLLLPIGLIAAYPSPVQGFFSDPLDTDVQDQSVQGIQISEKSATGGDQPAQEAKESPGETSSSVETKVEANSRVNISIKSSTTTRVNGVQTDSNTSTDSSSIQTVIENTDNGSSSVRFKVEAGPNADVKVKERNGRYRVDVKEKKEVDM